MQTVVDFLLEYYVWVLAVLGILLITVIGFLADTKKKKKLREKVEEPVTNMDNNVNQYPDFNNANLNMDMNQNNNMTNMNNNFNMSGDLNNNMANQVPNMDMNPNMMNPEPNMNQNMTEAQPFNPMANQNVNVQPQVNINNSVNDLNGVNNVNAEESNAFFVPASEQTPTFEPKEVNIQTPTPVAPTPIMNNNTEVVNSWGSMPTPVVEPTAVPNVGPAPVEVTSPVVPTPEVSPVVPMPNQVEMPSVSQVAPAHQDAPLPEPTNPVPVMPEVQAPVEPTLNTMAQPSNVQINPSVAQTPVAPVTPEMNINPNPVPQIEVPTNPTLAGGANFVTGTPNGNIHGNSDGNL